MFVAGSGCRSATELSVVVTTDVPCKSMRGASVTVGTVGSIDTSPPTAVTTFCDADTGNMGTLVVVPSGARDAELALRVVGGVGVDPESCRGASYGSGCIVARRALRYLPHQSMRLLVRLSATCQGVVCAPDQTCSLGVCKSANIDPSQCTSDIGCGDGALGSGGVPAGAPILVEGCGDVSGLQPGSPWPMKGRCNTRMSRSKAIGPVKANVKWTAPLDIKVLTCAPEFPQGCDVGGPVVAADGTIYTGGGDGLYAFAPGGARKWKAPLPRQVIATPAISSTGLVITPCLDGMLYAVSPGGSVAWSFKADSGLASAPAIAPDHTIYVTSLAGTLYAINEGGTVRWSSGTGVLASDVALSMDASVLYVGGKDRFYSMNPKDGTRGWDVGIDGQGAASVGLDRNIDIESSTRSLAVTPNGITLFGAPDSEGMAPVPVAQGAIFGAPTSHAWIARDVAGTILWSTVASAVVSQSVVIAGDGKIYGNDASSTLYILDANGTRLGQDAVGSPDTPDPSAMAIGADGTIYLTLTDGRLIAFHD